MYTVQEGVIAPVGKPGDAAPSALQDVYSVEYCRTVRLHLKQELGGEMCQSYPRGVLLPVNRRVRRVTADIPLAWVFDEIDLGSRIGRPAKLYHVVEETNDALGLLLIGKDEVLWFHR
jgi:hypothetical protein